MSVASNYILKGKDLQNEQYKMAAAAHLEKLCCEYIEGSLGEKPTQDIINTWLYTFHKAYFKGKLSAIEYYHKE